MLEKIVVGYGRKNLEDIMVLRRELSREFASKHLGQGKKKKKNDPVFPTSSVFIVHHIERKALRPLEQRHIN